MTTKDKKTTKDKSPKKPSRIMQIMHSERTKFIIGLLILLFSASLGVAFLSFLVTGKDDQALLENMPLSAIFSTNNGLTNWGGTVGAFSAEYCVNRWIGISAFLFVVFLFRLGFRLIQHYSIRPLFGVFVRTSLWAIWFSLFFGTICAVADAWFNAGMQSQFIYLGGKHGYDFSQLLIANLGTMGLLFVIIVTGLILSAFVFNSTIERTRRLFDVAPWFKVRYSDLRKKVLERQAKRQAEKEKAEEEARKAALLAQGQGNGEEDPENGNSNVLSDPELGNGNNIEAPENVDPETGEILPAANVFTPGATVVTDPVIAGNNPVITDPVTPNTDPVEPAPQGEGEGPIFTVTTGKTDIVSKPVAANTEDLPQEDYDPTADLSHYQFPGFDLLKAYDSSVSVDMDEQNENKEKIRQTLSDYGIEIQSISATVGPTITLFEIVLVSGTKISRVKNLSDEIAMSIASKSGIRIIAPIPGKSAIGIEVPNNDPKTVSMRDCISSRAFQEAKMDLPVALGKTITNEVFTFDLAKAPHLLVAGATGQGKSVGLNAIITSLLYKKHPSQLKIVLVDPKMVEFSIYKRIEKHYLAKLPDQENPIITDVTKTVDILRSLCAEMEDRYALVEDAGVRNIKEYNEKFIHRHLNPTKHITAPIGSREGTHHRYLPYIVAVIDEYGDLIMTAGKEVELPIARIAQKARAVGIHMIIATQRPSAKIVTGIIKANFPARIAFRVSQSIDSSIILDQPGAQNLIGRGDLLYSSGNVPVRVQCAFVDTPEVDRINHFIADQQSYPTALILPEPKLAEGDDDGGNSAEVDLNQLDSMFEEAAEMVVATGQGSTSMIQRKFSIGYNRAGRIMDQLEAAGIVGPYTGSKARAVLVDSDSELRQILEDLKNR